MENIDFVYLDGLHRPYNMPLKSIVWVCRFVKYMEDHSISILPSHFYGEFFRYHLHEVVKRHEIDEDKYKGMVSISKAKIVLNWLQDKANIEELESAISKILNKRKNKEERIVYSTYKNTSYYITLAKKMRYLNSYYKLEPDAYDLLTANKRFYSLSSTEKDNIFLHIILHDADVFLPLLLSLPFKRKALNGKRLLNYILCIRFFIEVHSIVSASRFFHMPTYLRVVIECQSRFFPFFPAFSRNCPDYFLHTSGSSSFRSLSDLGAR